MDMSLDFSEIYISLVSNIIGIDLKQIKRVLDKEKLRKSGQVEISDSIDVVSKKLEESKDIIDNALLEMEKQKKECHRNLPKEIICADEERCRNKSASFRDE